MAASDADSELTVDIIEEFEKDEERVEIAKKDLNSIFNKINKSLSDLESVGLSQSDGVSKSKINFREKSEVSFQVNKDIKLQTEDDTRRNLQLYSSPAHRNMQLRYSPELRVVVPSPGPPLFYHTPGPGHGDQCSLHQPASVTTSTSLGHLWSREEPYLRALSDKLCAGYQMLYWIIGTAIIILILLICIILLLS